MSRAYAVASAGVARFEGQVPGRAGRIRLPGRGPHEEHQAILRMDRLADAMEAQSGHFSDSSGAQARGELGEDRKGARPRVGHGSEDSAPRSQKVEPRWIQVG